jgi:Transposase and inactivated derivatives
MSSTRRVFPETFKREAVDRVVSSGLSVIAVARELGLHETVLRRWMMQFGAQATGAARRPTTQAPPRRRLTWPRRTPGSGARTSGSGWSATY